MGFDLSAAQASVGTYLQRVRYTAILAVLMIIPVAFLIVRRVTEPLQDLGSKVTQLASGDFQARADIRRRDEIGQLARLFNRMADELASKNDSLVKLNAELEDRVLQRTRQLVELASRDSLTALYNRRHLGEVLARRFAEAERYDTDLSCLMIDLDNFKKVNDQHGHALGDRLLILTANVIRSELRSSDVGARFGGDEFCVLLPQTTADRAMQLGSRIVERFQTEVKSQLGEAGTDFGISVGVAGMQELRLVHYDELMKAADQALYGAKDAGKNRIFLAESLVS
jgi:diguanylate cyclase (GGDEF)-like protein